MWPFTGGCHYSGECTRYVNRCGCCPQLRSRVTYDLSRWVIGKKLAKWTTKDLVVVSPSRWLAGCARSSSLFSQHRIEVIPNPLDLNIYKPIEKGIARDLLNLPREGKIALFVAINARHEPRKGYAKLHAGLDRLAEINPTLDLTLLVVGTGAPEVPESLPYKIRYLGRLHDDFSMALAYSAADVFVAPSLQENLPNTIMEAMACGTPCVAFDIGGIPDMITHRESGYLAKPFDPAELAEGMAWILANNERRRVLAERARQKIESISAPELVAGKYLDIYRELLSRSAPVP
jgi:glycosyltransferase involved in cell wall biosynthesis